jgi:hypothetical protein
MKTTKPPKRKTTQKKDSAIAEGQIIEHQPCTQEGQAKEPSTDKTLAFLEQRIDRNIREGSERFLEVAKDLLLIQRGKLYETDPLIQYSTFEDYCRRRWNLSRARAYECLNYLSVCKDVQPLLSASGRQSPTERALRPLVRLESNQRIEVMEAAIKEAGNAEMKPGVIRRITNKRYPSPKKDKGTGNGPTYDLNIKLLRSYLAKWDRKHWDAICDDWHDATLPGGRSDALGVRDELADV